MAEMSTYPPGTFCWVDLGTTDADAAKAFYTNLFGWEAIDVPAGDMGTYTMLKKDGKDVCALYQMEEAVQQQGMPSSWLNYIAVDHLDTLADQVVSLGGTLMQPPCDVMDAGRMALVQDAGGAVFALWEPKQHAGASLVMEPNTVCWNELQTKDLQQASEFYRALLGWETQTSAATEHYQEFMQGDRPIGGMLQIQPEWGDVPPNWSVYFAVADCDATLDQVKALGGRADMPPISMESVGRFAMVQDPQGAFFSIIQLAAQ